MLLIRSRHGLRSRLIAPRLPSLSGDDPKRKLGAPAIGTSIELLSRAEDPGIHPLPAGCGVGPAMLKGFCRSSTPFFSADIMNFRYGRSRIRLIAPGSGGTEVRVPNQTAPTALLGGP